MGRNTADVNLLLGQPLTLDLDPTATDDHMQRIPPEGRLLEGRLSSTPGRRGKAAGVASEKKLRPPILLCRGAAAGGYEFVWRAMKPSPESKPPAGGSQAHKPVPAASEGRPPRRLAYGPSTRRRGRRAN